MAGLGVAVALLLLAWCLLLHLPFRWRPAGMYLIAFKALAVAYVPYIAAISAVLVAVGAVLEAWWVAVPAAVAAVGAVVVMVHVGGARIDLAGALGAGWEQLIPSARRRRPRRLHRWWAGPLAKGPKPQAGDGAVEHLDALTRAYTRHPAFYGHVSPEDQRSRESPAICRIHPRQGTLDAVHLHDH